MTRKGPNRMIEVGERSEGAEVRNRLLLTVEENTLLDWAGGGGTVSRNLVDVLTVVFELWVVGYKVIGSNVRYL